MGNAGTLMLLQLGGPDADRLAKWLKPQVSAEDLTSLPELEAIMRTKGKGGQVHLFTMKNEPVRLGDLSLVERAWAVSDARDGRDAAEVERNIEQRLSGNRKEWSRDLEG